MFRALEQIGLLHTKTTRNDGTHLAGGRHESPECPRGQICDADDVIACTLRPVVVRVCRIRNLRAQRPSQVVSRVVIDEVPYRFRAVLLRQDVLASVLKTIQTFSQTSHRSIRHKRGTNLVIFLSGSRCFL